MAQPKRVILRIREAEINDEDLYEAVRVYFQASGHPVEGLNERRHFIHIQPSNPDIPQNDPKIHIVMDLEKNAYSGVLGDDFPHDLYRIHRIDGQMYGPARWPSNTVLIADQEALCLSRWSLI